MSTVQRPRRFIKRPDDKALKQSIESLRAEIKQLDLANAEINAQIEKTILDPNVAEKRKQLQLDLKEIITKQKGLKQERNAIQDQIRNVDTNLKRKITDIQKSTSKNNYKSVAEIESRISYLDNMVGSGTLILADERKYVKEMSSLRKLRKDFSEVEKQQESIDSDKNKIAELKKKLSSVSNKEVQQEFEKIQKELDEIFESNKSIYNKRTELMKKRAAIGKEKDAKYTEMRKLRTDFDAEFEKFKADMAEEQKKRDEEYKAEQEAQKDSKKRALAEKKLAEASIPAFTKEINEIHTLLAYFDPDYVKPQNDSVVDALKSSMETKYKPREVEMPSDVVILKKEQTPFFEGSKSKKSKKKTQKNKSLTVDSDIILSLADLSIPLPTKTEEVPETIRILKETLLALTEKQAEQTQVNIEKAKAEIAKLNAEDSVQEDAVSADEDA